MIELTDQNFEETIQNSQKPVLVDFWTFWCNPCSVLSPILEKIEKEYNDKIILAKVNLDASPFTAQKFKIEQIPTVILFKYGMPISGFVGVKPEPAIKEWLGKSQEIINKVMEKVNEIIKNYQEHAEKNGFRLNPDRKVVERLVMGLLANEKKYGVKYCPCRRITGNPEEDRGKICPCHWHKEEIEKDDHCCCSLFVK